MEYPTQIISAAIGALAMLGAAVVAYWGVLRKSGSSEAAAFLTAGVDMRKATAAAEASLRESLMQEIARIENERKTAEATTIMLRKELELCRMSRIRLIALIRKYVPAQTLEEISDIPEDI